MTRADGLMVLSAFVSGAGKRLKLRWELRVGAVEKALIVTGKAQSPALCKLLLLLLLFIWLCQVLVAHPGSLIFLVACGIFR